MLVYVCNMSFHTFISILESDTGTWVKLLSALKIGPHVLNKHPNRTLHSVLYVAQQKTSHTSHFTTLGRLASHKPFHIPLWSLNQLKMHSVYYCRMCIHYSLRFWIFCFMLLVCDTWICTRLYCVFFFNGQWM